MIGMVTKPWHVGSSSGSLHPLGGWLVLSQSDRSPRAVSGLITQVIKRQSIKRQTNWHAFWRHTSEGGMEAGRDTTVGTFKRPYHVNLANSGKTQSFRATATAMPTAVRLKRSGPTTSQNTLTRMVLPIQPVVPCGGLLSTTALLHG